MSGSASFRMSNPFCAVTLETYPIDGRVGSEGRPASFCRAALSARFLLHRRLRVSLGHERILRRVPHVVVDPVQDSRELSRAGAEEAVEAFPELWRLDFLRIGGADRVHEVRADDPGFHEIQLAVELGSFWSP